MGLPLLVSIDTILFCRGLRTSRGPLLIFELCQLGWYLLRQLDFVIKTEPFHEQLNPCVLDHLPWRYVLAFLVIWLQKQRLARAQSLGSNP